MFRNLDTFLLSLISLWLQKDSQESSNHWLWLFQSVQIKIYMGIGDRYVSHVATSHFSKYFNPHWTEDNSSELGINTLGIHTASPNAIAVSLWYTFISHAPPKYLPLFFFIFTLFIYLSVTCCMFPEDAKFWKRMISSTDNLEVAL